MLLGETNKMLLHTRRGFLTSGAMLAASTLLRIPSLLASPFGLPIGLQLYSVRELLPNDYQGTLKHLAALGYQEVEAAGFHHHSAEEVKQAMQAAPLRCVSAHYPAAELHQRLDEIIAFHQVLGAHYIICSSPAVKDPSRLSNPPARHTTLTLEDWRWNAGQFNLLGEKVKAAGMQFGYHNHIAEFLKLDGIAPYDELLRLTEPALVTMEMDCGWVMVGGADPVDYLHRYPDRISMLHVKDFKHSDHPPSLDAPPVSAELGQGTSNYSAVFKAASKANIKHYFVEQEQFDMPPYEALKIDADYMKKLVV
jgi:sugar phosphate isomerase/epimerase